MAVIAPPVFIAFVISRIVRRMRPESSFLLFLSVASRVSLDCFKNAVAEVAPNAAITATEYTMSAKTARFRLRVESYATPLKGAAGYLTKTPGAEAAVRGHRGWTSVVVSSRTEDRAAAKEFAGRVCALLIDQRASAIWTTDTAVVQVIDQNLVARLSAGSPALG